MSTIITVPAELVWLLREGAYVQLGNAAIDVAQATEHPDREARPCDYFAGPLERFDRARGLLGAIGWRPVTPVVAARLDLGEHGGVILAALRGEQRVEADTLKDLEQLSSDEQRRLEVTRRAATLGEFLTAVEAEIGALDRDWGGREATRARRPAPADGTNQESRVSADEQ